MCIKVWNVYKSTAKKCFVCACVEDNKSHSPLSLTDWGCTPVVHLQTVKNPVVYTKAFLCYSKYYRTKPMTANASYKLS